MVAVVVWAPAAPAKQRTRAAAAAIRVRPRLSVVPRGMKDLLREKR
jgi:hypothetical protein